VELKSQMINGLVKIIFYVRPFWMFGNYSAM